MSELFTDLDTGAVFSECRTWRYQLWRSWADGPIVAFIGLNPSTADERTDDNTIRRCVGFTRTWGYGRLVMLNLFAYRATLPEEMKAAADPIGPDNDAHIVEVCRGADLVIAAWGVDGGFLGRDQKVRELLRDINVRHLGLTKGGFPRHPLYLAKSTKPIRWEA